MQSLKKNEVLMSGAVLNIPVWVHRKTGAIYTKKPKGKRTAYQHIKAGESIYVETGSVTNHLVDIGIVYG